MPTVSTLASAMFGVEGYNPNFAGNNNPGNLMYVGQQGATLGAGGFAAYPTLAQGQAAAENQINLNLTRGSCANGNPIENLIDLISCWSPPNASGNSSASTNNYISTVANATGIDPSANLAAQLTNGGIQDTQTSATNSLDALFTGGSDGSFDISFLIDPSQPYLYAGLAGIALYLYFN